MKTSDPIERPYRNRRGQPTRMKKVNGKYVTETIPNPEWIQSEEYKEEERAKLMQIGTPCEDMFPEDNGKDLPPEGGWIMILTSVHVGKQLDGDKVERICVPRLSIWFAKPMRERHNLYQAVINTPQGPVHIWPHEYQRTDIAKWLEFSEKDGFLIHFMSDKGAFEEPALFYLRSRGIPVAEAQRMLLGTLKDQNYCYFTFAPELVCSFTEGTGTGYLQPHNHARRAAARAGRLERASTRLGRETASAVSQSPQTEGHAPTGAQGETE